MQMRKIINELTILGGNPIPINNLICRASCYDNVAHEFRKSENGNNCFTEIPTRKICKTEKDLQWAMN